MADFFILADTCGYFIHHIDVYQGKNIVNVDINDALKSLPKTQKTTANVIIQSGIANNIDGLRCIFMDTFMHVYNYWRSC